MVLSELISADSSDTGKDALSKVCDDCVPGVVIDELQLEQIQVPKMKNAVTSAIFLERILICDPPFSIFLIMKFLRFSIFIILFEIITIYIYSQQYGI